MSTSTNTKAVVAETTTFGL